MSIKSLGRDRVCSPSVLSAADEYELNPTDLRIEGEQTKLGAGTFAVVYRGLLKAECSAAKAYNERRLGGGNGDTSDGGPEDKETGPDEWMSVAVKVLHAHSEERDT